MSESIVGFIDMDCFCTWSSNKSGGMGRCWERYCLGAQFVPFLLNTQSLTQLLRLSVLSDVAVEANGPFAADVKGNFSFLLLCWRTFESGPVANLARFMFSGKLLLP